MCTKAVHLINICIYANKYIGHETANWLGCGGRRSAYYRSCGGGIVEALALAVIVARASPYDGDGSPYYAGFKACLEFFRSYGLLDWSTLIFEWQ